MCTYVQCCKYCRDIKMHFLSDTEHTIFYQPGVQENQVFLKTFFARNFVLYNTKMEYWNTYDTCLLHIFLSTYIEN